MKEGKKKCRDKTDGKDTSTQYIVHHLLLLLPLRLPLLGSLNIIIDVLDPCWKCAPLLLFCERKGRQGIFMILLSLFFSNIQVFYK